MQRPLCSVRLLVRTVGFQPAGRGSIPLRSTFLLSRVLSCIHLEKHTYENGGQMNSIIVEIRAGEGGADARALVREQAEIYRRVCERRSL